MHLQSFVTALVLATTACATNCNFTGGYAIREPERCNGDSPVTCDGGYLSKRCCPAGYYCDLTDNAYCCPTQGGCVKSVLDVPRVRVALPISFLTEPWIGLNALLTALSAVSGLWFQSVGFQRD